MSGGHDHGSGHDHDHGEGSGLLQNMGAAGYGPLRRAWTVALNIGRRVTHSPHDCCGHYGEPGC